MELYAEILAHYISSEIAWTILPGLQFDAKEIIELQCYQALQRIKDILEDESLEDDACFAKIEEIICAFEAIGSSGGSRHDFG